jgi:hypothetical protein
MDPVTIMLIASLASGLFNYLGNRSSANSAAAAARFNRNEQGRVAKQNFQEGETARIAAVPARARMLESVQRSLGPGAPDYTLPADLIASMMTRRSTPVGTTANANPGAGLGYNYLSGLASTVGSLAGNADQAARSRNFWDEWQRTQNSFRFDNPAGPTPPNYTPTSTSLNSVPDLSQINFPSYFPR